MDTVVTTQPTKTKGDDCMWTAKCYRKGCGVPHVFMTNDLFSLLKMAADDYSRGLVKSGEVRWTISK